MNPKLLRRLLVSVVAVGAFAGLYYYTHAPLLRIRLPDGTEIRVLKVAYGTGENHEHEFAPPSQLKLRLIHLLPQSWQNFSIPPSQQQRSSPMVSIWWTYYYPYTFGNPVPSHMYAIITADTDKLGSHDGYSGFLCSDGHGVHGWPASELVPGKSYRFFFPPLQEGDKTLTVYMKFNGEPVTFSVPIPAPSE